MFQKKVCDASNRFVFLNSLKVHMAKSFRGGSYNDPMVTINYVPLLPIDKKPIDAKPVNTKTVDKIDNEDGLER